MNECLTFADVAQAIGLDIIVTFFVGGVAGMAFLAFMLRKDKGDK